MVPPWTLNEDFLKWRYPQIIQVTMTTLELKPMVTLPPPMPGPSASLCTASWAPKTEVELRSTGQDTIFSWSLNGKLNLWWVYPLIINYLTMKIWTYINNYFRGLNMGISRCLVGLVASGNQKCKTVVLSMMQMFTDFEVPWWIAWFPKVIETFEG